MSIAICSRRAIKLIGAYSRQRLRALILLPLAGHARELAAGAGRPELDARGFAALRPARCTCAISPSQGPVELNSDRIVTTRGQISAKSNNDNSTETNTKRTNKTK